jgi:hypothetical protein
LFGVAADDAGQELWQGSGGFAGAYVIRYHMIMVFHSGQVMFVVEYYVDSPSDVL